MSDNPKQRPDGDNNELGRLIHEAGWLDATEFQRPSDDVISAYLLGKANRAQIKQVRSALLLSSEFRKEIAQLTEALEEIPAGKFFAPSTKNRAQDEVLESLGSRLVRELKALLVPTSLPQWVTSGAAVVVLVALSLAYLMRGNELVFVTPNLVTKSVEIDKLKGISTRSSDSIQPTGFPTAEEAALDAMRSVLEYHDGVLTVLPQRAEAQAASGKSVELQITTTSGAKNTYEAFVSESAGAAATDVEFWILVLPKRALYKLPLATLAGSAKLDISASEQFVVALTWRNTDLYFNSIASPK